MATAGRTYNLFTNTLTGAETGSDDHSQLAMNPNADALAQVSMTNGSVFTLTVQGRMNDTLPWAQIFSFTETETIVNDTGLVSFRMMPHLRVVVASGNVTAGGLTVDVMN